MIKVFYSVDYMISGSDKKHQVWFDNIEEAKEFSEVDYCRGNPVAHKYRSAKAYH